MAMLPSEVDQVTAGDGKHDVSIVRSGDWRS